MTDVIPEDFLERWQKRVIADLDEFRKIKAALLSLAASREDAELAEIAYKLHLARCHLADTITLRFGPEALKGAEQDECEDHDTQETRET